MKLILTILLLVHMQEQTHLRLPLLTLQFKQATQQVQVILRQQLKLMLLSQKCRSQSKKLQLPQKAER